MGDDRPVDVPWLEVLGERRSARAPLEQVIDLRKKSVRTVDPGCAGRRNERFGVARRRDLEVPPALANEHGTSQMRDEFWRVEFQELLEPSPRREHRQ